jgi:type III secretory pathway lipoprotein EscJ
MVGCKSASVADDLAQKDANQIVAALRAHGIDATTEKGRGSKGRYTVNVASARFGEAATLLSQLGLPAERGASFAELMAPSGILPPSKDVEDLRMDRAIASEVEDLLMGHPAVAGANVIVRLHSIPASSIASVSVVVQKKEGVDFVEGDVKSIVIRAVPGIKPEAISLSVNAHRNGVEEAPEAGKLVPFLLFWEVPVHEYNGLAMFVMGLFASVAVLAGLGGYIYGQYALSKTGEPLSGSGEPTLGARTRRDDAEDDK